MREGQSTATLLREYQPPSHFIETTRLCFDIRENETLVSSELQLRKNPDSLSGSALVLHGEQLSLETLLLDGKRLQDSEYQLTDSSLSIAEIPDSCVLQCVTRIDPSSNLSLEGLYCSDGMYCTQCEAEGFRKITYYLDRPDVMSVFTVKVIADAQRFPVLLSNGNEVGRGECEGDAGRHWVEWHDPFKKPAYLFALVAGDLAVASDSFTTCSGRRVELQIYVEAKDLDKTAHAMLSLQNAMRWDEQVYGREYDLDRYMIVAVDFFNMGAMENKGLNIFNTSCVLAHPQTQTDQAFQRVEAVIAHEYFHNWSGNRVTCRDWFQLSLKEGFTVFRDAQFSADMNSATVKRIEDVNLLRSAQFAEDAGPMSHPVRPESYIEISNFYTLTIYEKGAEVIRMMHELLGAEAFRRGSDLYFDRHDGQAVTCEDFVLAMEDASGIDLTQFRNWYSQAGTPQLSVSDTWDAEQGVYRLQVEQSCPATPGQPQKAPFHIPLKLALVCAESSQLEGGEQPLFLDGQSHKASGAAQGAGAEQELVLDIRTDSQSFEFFNLSARPVPSLLRGFSAPVKLQYDYTPQGLLLLLRYDSDGFVRWDASRRYLFQLIEGHLSGSRPLADQHEAIETYASCLRQLITTVSLNRSQPVPDELDPALLSEILSMPGYAFLVEQLDDVDPLLLHEAVRQLTDILAKSMSPVLEGVYRETQQRLAELAAGYRARAEDIALRSLKNICLSYLMRADVESNMSIAMSQFNAADNMTDRMAALTSIVQAESDTAVQQSVIALNEFYQRYAEESLVVNQWLSVQAVSERSGALQRIAELRKHPAYDETNPNKVRALIGAFCARNLPGFHQSDGSGYKMLADEVIRLDAINPQLASRLLAPLTQYSRFASDNRRKMRAELQRIANSGNLSADVFEVVSKCLA